MTLIGSFFVMFCSVGFINAFGIFEEYYGTVYLPSKSASDISWLGSFNLFIMFGLTLPVGFLNDKFGPEVLMKVGSVITLLALFLASISKSYATLFLTQGFLFGLGCAITILPAFATVPRWFVKGRGLAMGIVVSGSSLGGVIWPIVLRRLLYNPSVGFGWAVRISAFIMLPLLLIACVTIKLPKTNKAQGHGKPDLSIVKNPVLIILACSLFFVYLGLFSPFFYITGWTISLGLNVNMGFYMVSIINAASLFGRIIPGVLADKMGPYNVMILSAGLSGIICVTWTSAKSIGTIVVLSLAYGFASGAVIGLQGACAAAIAKPSQYGVAMGAMMAVVSIAGLIGSPINGQILAAHGYLGVALFSGLALILGMVVLIPARLKLNRNPIAKA
ncbi:MFS monocarboxylate transporter-like protein [Mollisia scopiformis]|uniref:MFS monocarboxylate transporter-like protein n=1 Tax=Mollisia scopiformis TaxID=149040 RepID=A0A194WS18_MOLSC|nr:MFS monocarboxylate transporter-like protein [Mollisia scopiformis]KUJ10775.1 MFS monocarboxylate transporter-like protein [Mollisia scopiformis]